MTKDWARIKSDDVDHEDISIPDSDEQPVSGDGDFSALVKDFT